MKQDMKVTKRLLHIFGYRLEPNREIFRYIFQMNKFALLENQENIYLL